LLFVASYSSRRSNKDTRACALSYTATGGLRVHAVCMLGVCSTAAYLTVLPGSTERRHPPRRHPPAGLPRHRSTTAQRYLDSHGTRMAKMVKWHSFS